MWARRMRSVGVGALCVMLLAACSGGDDIAETPVLELSETGPGTCLQVPDDLPAEVEKLPVIDCSLEHTHEIYAVVDYTEGDVFPGLEALNAFAERTCLAEFEPYVGISIFDSQLEETWLVPTLKSWNEEDDTEVLCVLADFQAAPLVGSMKGSGR